MYTSKKSQKYNSEGELVATF